MEPRPYTALLEIGPESIAKDKALHGALLYASKVISEHPLDVILERVAAELPRQWEAKEESSMLYGLCLLRVLGPRIDDAHRRHYVTVSYGLLPVLFDLGRYYLGEGNNADIATNVVLIATDLANSSTDAMRKLADLGAIEFFASALRSANLRLAEAAVWGLSDFAGDSHGLQTRVLACDIIPTLGLIISEWHKMADSTGLAWLCTALTAEPLPDQAITALAPLCFPLVLLARDCAQRNKETALGAIKALSQYAALNGTELSGASLLVSVPHILPHILQLARLEGLHVSAMWMIAKILWLLTAMDDTILVLLINLGLLDTLSELLSRAGGTNDLLLARGVLVSTTNISCADDPQIVTRLMDHGPLMTSAFRLALRTRNIGGDDVEVGAAEQAVIEEAVSTITCACGNCPAEAVLAFAAMYPVSVIIDMARREARDQDAMDALEQAMTKLGMRSA